MSIELTDFQKLYPKYSTLMVSEIQLTDTNAVNKCLSIIREWQKVSTEWGKSLSEVQQDYQLIVNLVVGSLQQRLRRAIIPGEKLLAAFSKEGKLEGIAITQSMSSRKKKTPFTKVAYLLTAVRNVCSDSEENAPKVKGAGCALLAKAIKLEDKGKCLYLSSTSSAESFYEKMGFIPTNRQESGAKRYKLPADNFWNFISKRAFNVSFS